jgi:rubrerythrin
VNDLLKLMARIGAASPQIVAPKLVQTQKTQEQLKASLDYVYKCLKCGYTFRAPEPMPSCPLDDHPYVSWLSFKTDMRRLGRA